MALCVGGRQDQWSTYASVGVGAGTSSVCSLLTWLFSTSNNSICHPPMHHELHNKRRPTAHILSSVQWLPLTLIPCTLWQPVCCVRLACPSLKPNRKIVPTWRLQILDWWQCNPLFRIPPPTLLPLCFGRCEILIASLGTGLFLSVISDQNIILSCKYNYWDGRGMGVLLGGRESQAWEDYWERAMAFFLNHLSSVC